MCGICGYKLNRDFKKEKILENLIKEIEKEVQIIQVFMKIKILD